MDFNGNQPVSASAKYNYAETLVCLDRRTEAMEAHADVLTHLLAAGLSEDHRDLKRARAVDARLAE